VESYRLKIRIGGNEFEAEGDKDAVQSQFEAWKDLVANMPASTPTLASPPPPALGAPAPLPSLGLPAGGSALFEKLFRREGPVVSITILPTGTNRDADAALLILFGQKLYNGDDQVTGGRMGQGLDHSGVAVPRVDRMFGDYMPQYVIRSGVRRAVRYRLTNPGYAKAQEIATELVNSVP
jgi:hypothetical protein